MKPLQHKISRCVSIMLKPMRIFQFFAVLLVFAITIYMIVMDPQPISSLACILLLVLSGIYVFVLAVDLISHFSGAALHVIPMALFSFLGFLFFGIGGGLLFSYGYTELVVQVVAIALCLLAALFFLIDITMVLAFWKRRCLVCRECCHNSVSELLLYKPEPLLNKTKQPSIVEEPTIMKHNATTSLSDIKLPRELEDVAIPDLPHCYRRVEYPRRREYVDCPTCVPSFCNLGVAQIQTETKRVSIVESQTPSVVTKETPIQTLNKCEFCQQHIQLPLAEGVNAQYPGWSYPAIVQFVRGGAMPCCPGCKCSASLTQQQQQELTQQQQQELTQQQQQELTQQRKKVSTPRVKSNPSKTVTSETAQQVTNTENGDDSFTRVKTVQPATYTVASFYGPDKKAQTADIIYKQKVDATKIKENVNPTSENVDRKLASESIMKIAKAKRSEETGLEHINVRERDNEDKAEGNEEDKRIGVNKKIERSKGGGEHCTKVHQEFMRTMEQGSMANLEDSIHTSGTLITPLSSRTKSRTLLHLKSNKVDPIKDANVFDDEDILEKVTTLRTALDNQAVQESDNPARIGSPSPTTERRLNDACSHCRRQSLTPISDNTRCYVVFKDKNGKYFCEFCAPLDSKKITIRHEGIDLRRLRCTNCRLYLRERSARTNVKLKSDTCPKCGRSQGHAASPSST